MRMIQYCSMILFIAVVFAVTAENFIQKKAPIKKQPYIKQEDIVVGNGEALIEITQLLQELYQVQDVMVHDAYDIGIQKKDHWFCSATQQEKRDYENCRKKIQNSIKQCTQAIREEYPFLKVHRSENK